jgi:prophage regulatory protein
MTIRDLMMEKRERIIRKKELLAMVGLSDATVWRKEKKGDFPIRLKLGGNSCGWLESEVYGWIDKLSAAREA